MRRLVEFTVFTLLLVLVVRTFLAQGWLRPVRVHGPSMAPHYPGDHYRVECQDCRFPYQVGARLVPRNGPVVCPNCGYRQPFAQPSRRFPGQRLWVDRASPVTNGLQRWQVVSLDEPEQVGQRAVKRIVGLPGERITIRDGNLYINDHIARRTWREIRNMAILVHADAYRPHREEDVGWSPWEVESSSQPLEIAEGLDARGTDVRWIRYRHRPTLPPPAPRATQGWVQDTIAYNQSLQRPIHSVPDLLLTFRLQIETPGILLLEYVRDDRAWQVCWDIASRTVQIRQPDHDAVQIRVQTVRLPKQVSFGSVDGELLLAIDDRLQLRHEMTGPDRTPNNSEMPLAIGLEKISARITNLTVWRDIVYLHPDLTRSDWPSGITLASDEYLVLGDNGAVSRDGRHWGAIREQQIVGRVWRWPATRGVPSLKKFPSR